MAMAWHVDFSIQKYVCTYYVCAISGRTRRHETVSFAPIPLISHTKRPKWVWVRSELALEREDVL